MPGYTMSVGFGVEPPHCAIDAATVMANMAQAAFIKRWIVMVARAA